MCTCVSVDVGIFNILKPQSLSIAVEDYKKLIENTSL